MPWKNLRHHTKQSSQAKIPQLLAGSGLLHPPTSSTYPPPGASRETSVSPPTFNLAKQTCPTSPFGKQNGCFQYLFHRRLNRGAERTRPGQGFPYKWVWCKQLRLRLWPGLTGLESYLPLSGFPISLKNEENVKQPPGTSLPVYDSSLTRTL